MQSIKRIRRLLFLVFRNIYYYRVDYIRVFVIALLLQSLAVIPTMTLLLSIAFKLAGISGVTEQNIWQVLVNPVVLVALLCVIVMVLLFIYYEMGMLFLLAYYQQRGKKYTLIGLFKQLNRKATYFFNFQLFILLLYIILLVPLASTVLPISILQHLQIPNFIVDELMTSTKGKVLYFGVLTLLFVIALRFIFTLPYFTIHKHTTIFESLKLSWRFSRRKLLEMLGMLAFVLAIYSTLAIIVLAVIFLPLFMVERYVPNAALITAAFTLALAQGVIFLLFTLLQSVFSQVIVLVAFRLTHYKPVIMQNESFRKTVMRRFAVMAGCIWLLYGILNTFSLEKTLYEPSTKVIAHRGFVSKGVENTISSIEASAAAGAQMVEIDIQQTKDGKFVVFHDKTLYRLAGHNEAVYNLTQSELMEVEVKSGTLKGTIPSLEQVLEVSKKLNIELLIEVKPHGHETDDFLQRIVTLLNKYDAVDTHWLQSLDISLMQQLNEIEPRLIVGATYAMSIGALSNEGVDFVSLEQFFVTSSLIEQSKTKDVPLLVWTVNDYKGLQRYFESNIAGIITNSPDVAVSMQKKFNENSYFLHRVMNKIQLIF